MCLPARVSAAIAQDIGELAEAAYMTPSAYVRKVLIQHVQNARRKDPTS